MRDCASAREELKAYLDGELETAQVAEVEAHLQGCPACREELESLSDLCWRIGQIGEPESPPELSASILRRVRKTRTIRRWAWRLLPALGFAAAAVLVFALWKGPLLGAGAAEHGSAYSGAEVTKSGATGPAGGNHNPPPMPNYPRTVTVREWALDVEARDVVVAQQKTEELAKENGWLITPVEMLGGVQLVIEAGRADGPAALRALRRLGRVASEEDQTRNARAELVDNELRIRSLLRQEHDYLRDLEYAATIPDVLDLDANIQRVREQRGRLRAQNDNLLRMSRITTIRLTLRHRD